MRIAFLIIDVQKAYVEHRKNQDSYEVALWYINATAELFRKYKAPVYVIRHLEGVDGPNYQCVDELKTSKEDVEITKTHSNSFYETTLEQQLKDQGIDTVVISGNALEHCVVATYFGGTERGFKVLFLQRGIIALHDKNLEQLYFERPLISYTAIDCIFNNT